jgi:hypothetical protein
MTTTHDHESDASVLAEPVPANLALVWTGLGFVA